MKNKKLALLILALIVTISLATTGIVAWLTDSKTTPSVTLKVGEVEYEWVGGTIKKTPVVPGESILATSYALENKSTVTSELRMRISVSLDDLDKLEDLQITIASGWVLDEEDGYYYYRVPRPTDNKYPIPAENQNILVIEEIILRGDKVGNDKADKTYTITVTFEAKQNDYVAWADLGTIDFETGL